MLDIKFVCNNPDVVKQNIKNKFQDEKLPLVDEVIDLYQKSLKAKQESEALRANRNKLSKQIGVLMGQAKQDPSKKEEAEAVKAQVSAQAEEMKRLTAEAAELTEKVRAILLTIPNIIFGFYGMNITTGLPLDHFWWIPLAIVGVVVLVAAVLLKKKDLF